MPNEINPFDFNIDKFDSGFLGPITDSNFRTFLFTHNLNGVNPEIQNILGGNATQDRGTEYDVSQSTFNVTDVPSLGTVANTPSVYNNLTNPRQVNIGRNLPSVNPEVASEIGGTVTLQNQGLGGDAATLINNNPTVVDVPNLQNVASTPSVYNDLTSPRQTNLGRNLPNINPQVSSDLGIDNLNQAGLGIDSAQIINQNPTIVDVPDLQSVANTPNPSYNNNTTPRQDSLDRNMDIIDPEVASSLGISSFSQAGLGVDAGIKIADVSNDSINNLPNVGIVATTPSNLNNSTNPTEVNLVKNPTTNELVTWHPDYAYWFTSENDTYKQSFQVPNTLKLGFVGNVDGWSYPNGMVTTTYMIRDLGYFKQNNKYGPEQTIRYNFNQDAAKPAGVDPKTSSFEVIDDETGFKSYNYADSLGEKLIDQLLNRQLGVGIIPFSTIGSGINFRPDGELSQLDVIARKRRGVELLNRIKLNVIGDTIGRINIDPVSLLSGGKLIEKDYTITQRKFGTFGLGGSRTVNLNPLDLISDITGFNIPLSPLTDSDLINIFTFYGKNRNQNENQKFIKSVLKASNKFARKFKRQNDGSDVNNSSAPPPPSSKIVGESPLQLNSYDIPENLLAKTGNATRQVILENLDENKYTPVIQNRDSTVLKNFGTKVSNGNYLVNENDVIGGVSEDVYNERDKNTPNPDASSVSIPSMKPGFFGSAETFKEEIPKSTSDELGFSFEGFLEIDYDPTTYDGTDLKARPNTTVGTENFSWKNQTNTFKRGLLRYTQNIVNNNRDLGMNGGYIGYFDSDESGVNERPRDATGCRNCGHKVGNNIGLGVLNKPLLPSKGNQTRNVRINPENGIVEQESGDRYCRSWTSRRKYNNYNKLIRKGGTWWRDNLDKTDLTMNWDGNQQGGAFTNSPKISWNSLDEERSQKAGFAGLISDLLGFGGSNSAVPGEMIPYMLSIENLAWKGSPHYGKLPECEKGPNGGRIMWFPPYNIEFSDSNSVQWDKTDFIGRGEPIYTYNSAERSGTLDFTIIVDHPDVLNNMKKQMTERQLSDDFLHSFFAGCDDDTIREFFSKKIPEPELDLTVTEEKIPEFDDFNFDLKDSFKYYFDNAYTANDRENTTKSGRHINDSYEIKTPDCQITEEEWFNNSSIFPCGPAGNYSYNPLNLIEGGKFVGLGGNKTKLDLIEDLAIWLVSTEEGKNSTIVLKSSASAATSPKSKVYNETLVKDRYDNSKKYLYDRMIELEKDYEPVCIDAEKKYCYPKEAEMKDDPKRWKPYVYEEDTTIYDGEKYKEEFFSSDVLYNANEFTNTFKEDFTNDAIGKGNPCGRFINTTGDKGKLKFNAKGEVTNLTTANNINTDYFLSPLAETSELGMGRPNSQLAKKSRWIEFSVIKNTNSECGDIAPTRASLNKCWKKELENASAAKFKKDKADLEKKNQILTEEYKKKIAEAYVKECDYFEALKQDSPIVYNSLKDKIKNFHPAFHSMTPEGLNSRLTFLLQCTRQGPQLIDPTIPSNMVFGRPPICVLRIGDFYHTKIVIDNVNLTYEPLQWDLNPEGIGVQPMITKVSIGFKFIGGSSLGGPITQLQNAVSFNFFANTAIYERATIYTSDRFKYIYGAFRSPEEEKNLLAQVGNEVTQEVQQDIAKQEESTVNTTTDVKNVETNTNTKNEIQKQNSNFRPYAPTNKLEDVIYEAEGTDPNKYEIKLIGGKVEEIKPPTNGVFGQQWSSLQNQLTNPKTTGGYRTIMRKDAPSTYGIQMSSKPTIFANKSALKQYYIDFNDNGKFNIRLIIRSNSSSEVFAQNIYSTGKYSDFNYPTGPKDLKLEFLTGDLKGKIIKKNAFNPLLNELQKVLSSL